MKIHTNNRCEETPPMPKLDENTDCVLCRAGKRARAVLQNYNLTPDHAAFEGAVVGWTLGALMIATMRANSQHTTPLCLPHTLYFMQVSKDFGANDVWSVPSSNDTVN